MPELRTSNRTLKTREQEHADANAACSKVDGGNSKDAKYRKDLDVSGRPRVWGGREYNS